MWATGGSDEEVGSASFGGKSSGDADEEEENDHGRDDDDNDHQGRKRKQRRKSTAVKEEPLSPEEEAAALTEKRRKHNLVESRRRARVNQKFLVLRKLTNAAKGDRGSILMSAIEKLQELKQDQECDREEIQRLREQLLTTPGRRRYQTSADGRDLNPMADQPLYGDRPLASEIDYHDLFLRSGIGMAVMRIDGQFLDCNLAFEHLSAYPREELVKTNLFALTLPEYLPKMFMCVRTMLAGETTVCDIGKRMIGKGGLVFALNCLVTVAHDDPSAPPPYFICLGPPTDVLVGDQVQVPPPVDIQQYLPSSALQSYSEQKQQQQPHAQPSGSDNRMSSAFASGSFSQMPGPGSPHAPSPSPSSSSSAEPSANRGFLDRLPFSKRSDSPTPY